MPRIPRWLVVGVAALFGCPCALADEPLAAGLPLPEGARFRFANLQLRQPGFIRNSALSPDGKLLATAARRSVVIWDLNSGKAVRQFQVPDRQVFTPPGLTFSQDGTMLAFFHGVGAAFVWNVKTGRQLIDVSGKHLDNVSENGQFTNDGTQIVTAYQHGIRFLDLKSGNSDRFLWLRQVKTFSPDGRTYVRVDEKEATVVGDVATGKDLVKLDAASASAHSENGHAFSPDGKWLALVNIDKAIELYDATTWKLHAAVPLPTDAFRKERKDGSRTPVYRVGLTRDAKLLFLGMGDGTLRRWEVSTKKELPPLHVHLTRIANLHDLPDGNTLVTTGFDGLIRRWNLATGELFAEPGGYTGRTHAALAPDGRFVVVGDARGKLDLWNATTGKPLRTLRKDGPAVAKLAFDAKSEIIAVAQHNGSIGMWTASGVRDVKSLALPKSNVEFGARIWVQSLRFSPDAQSLYACNLYSLMRFDLSTEEVAVHGMAGDFALSADAATLATAYLGKLTLRDAISGKVRIETQIRDENERIRYAVPLAFSPDGRLLGAGFLDGYIALFDAFAAKERHRFFAVAKPNSLAGRKYSVSGRVTTLQFSPDGRWLLSGGTDDCVRLWEVATEKLLKQFDGHEVEVSEVAFGPDGRTAFSSAGDGLSYSWDLRPRGIAKQTLQTWWESLASEDAGRAYRAIWALSDDPKGAAEWLRSNVIPVKAPDPKLVQTLIADLDSAIFRTREQAQQELAKHGDCVAGALREALKKPNVLETQRRLDKLLADLDRPPPSSELREIRAIQALELSAAPEAQALLRQWATGAPGARLTENAAASLARLKRWIKD